MLFNSLAFVVFFVIVFIVYWALPHKYRWALILVSSYYFYMCWNIKCVLLIFVTTLISYLAALAIEKKQDDKKAKKLILSLTAVVCLGVLAFYKYFNFISQSVIDVLNLFSLNVSPLTLSILLPVGISFYTFQTLSYVIDVYRGDVEAERHFGKYAAFISFFPQLVAGPIERSSNLLPQIKKEQKFEYSKATYGLKIMAVGYFKKVIIADTLAKFVSKVYDAPSQYTGFALVLATVFFAIQIYCDFSGYSDIAVGVSKIIGIDLMTNFKSPYFAQSIKEFWSRWHISLSTWFKDYVYIPLGGNRVGRLRHYFNLILTFLVSGLWHGANWTFVVWGGIHGGVQVLENILFPQKYRSSKGVLSLFRMLMVFAFCCFAWIFFVSSSIGEAWYVICHLLEGIGNPVAYVSSGLWSIGILNTDLLFIGISVIILGIYDYCSLKTDVIQKISSLKPVARWAIYCCFALWVIFNFPAVDAVEFIYFQF